MDDETKVDEAPAADGEAAPTEEKPSEEAQKTADSIFNLVMKKLENQIDHASEVNKDARKGKLYTGRLSTDELAKMKLEERAGKFIRAIAYGDRQLAQELSGKAQPLNEGTGAAGGFLVPEEWASSIVEKVEQQAIVRPRATVVKMTRDTFNLPQIATSAQAYWRSESAVKQTTSLTFAQNTLTPYSLASIIIASEELLQDNDYNLVQIITNEMARRFADREDQAFLTGSGTGQPTGIDAYTPGFTVSAGGAMTGDHLIDAYHEMAPALRSKAVWMMHPRNLGLVRKLKDSSNRYLFELNAGIQGALQPSILGRPVLESSHLDQDRIYLVDLSYYYIGDRQGFTLDTSRDATVAGRSMFERNEVAFRAEERVDGELAWTNAYVLVDDVRTGD